MEEERLPGHVLDDLRTAVTTGDTHDRIKSSQAVRRCLVDGANWGLGRRERG